MPGKIWFGLVNFEISLHCITRQAWLKRAAQSDFGFRKVCFYDFPEAHLLAYSSRVYET